MQASSPSSSHPDGAIRLGAVVVGEDGAPASRSALKWASRHVAGDLHVVRAVSPGLELLEASFQIDTSTMIEHATIEVAEAMNDVAGQSMNLCPHIVEDSPPNALIDTAHRYGVDAIIVGATGHQKSRHLVGAHIGRLIHMSDLPVIVVPEVAEAADGASGLPPASPSDIVVGITGDAATDERLLGWARRAVGPARTLVLMHAIPPSGLADLGMHSAFETLEARVANYMEELGAEGQPKEPTVVFNDPLAALAEASIGADLVIVGSHRSSKVSGYLTGSMAQHLPAMASCPVALIPMTDVAPSGTG